MNSKGYKWCIVPQCENNSKKTPNKLFIYVPHSDTIRFKWFTLARKDPTSLSLKSPIHFCEDHFDLPNDMENYMQYHLMGSVAQVRMKPGCIPSKFDCQINNKRKGLEKPHAKKGRKKRVGERQNEMVEIEIDIEDNLSASSDAVTNNEGKKSYKTKRYNKACQTKRSTHLCKETTFICNRYIYSRKCEAEIQVEIAPKMIPINSIDINLPKIKSGDKSTETESKYFIISTTKYKPLLAIEDFSEKERNENEQEIKNEELGEFSVIENEPINEGEDLFVISTIKTEPETVNEENTAILKVKSETDNVGFSNTARIKNEPDNEEFPKVSIEENDEQCTKTTLKSDEGSNNELFMEISSIKSEAMDEVSENTSGHPS